MQNDSCNVSRQTLRQWERTRRAGISEAERLNLNAQIAHHCVMWLQAQNFKPQSRIALFWPIYAEPSILSVMKHPKCIDWLWALPKVKAKDQPLQFVEYNDLDLLTVDTMGIATPTLERICTVDVMFIPCLGFNAQGFRLGYGGGFYDRTLARSEYENVPTIGIAYSNSQLNDFSPNSHDIALQQIITERGCFFDA